MAAIEVGRTVRDIVQAGVDGSHGGDLKVGREGRGL